MNDRDRFDKFTERARRVLHLAQEEAQRFHHSYISVEHILLGLVREGEGVAAKALLHFGVDLHKLRTAVVEVSSSGKEATSNQIGLTPQGKKAIEMAVEEARRLNHHYIGTEHLLLALIRQHDETIMAIFDKLGVKLEDVSNLAASILTQTSASRSSASTSAPPSSNRDRFDRFSPSAKKALSLAQEEAQRFQHNYIGSEHLLLGLVREPDGLSSQILSSLGLELVTVRESVEFIVGRGDRIVLGEISLTPRAKRIVEQAGEEATLLGSPTVETEHLLLAIVRESEGIALGILESLGVEKPQVYTRTLAMLGQEIAARDVTPPQSSQGRKTPRVSADELSEPTEAEEASIQRIIQGLSAVQKVDTDKFTEQLRRVLTFAANEAARFQHNYIGTEHLLLGLAREPKGIAAEVLARLGVELPKVRSAVEFIIGRGSRLVIGEIGLTPRSKKIIELAADEARLLNHDYIGTEHLLLGLVREGEGIAAGVLESMGVNLVKVRVEVRRQLNQQ